MWRPSSSAAPSGWSWARAPRDGRGGPRLAARGARLEARFARDGAEGTLFVRGFLTASLLYCVGPMTILGSIQDGLTGDYQLLAIKSVLDGFAAMALASTLGVGVLFSSIIILLYQGGISLLA